MRILAVWQSLPTRFPLNNTDSLLGVNVWSVTTFTYYALLLLPDERIDNNTMQIAINVAVCLISTSKYSLLTLYHIEFSVSYRGCNRTKFQLPRTSTESL